MERNLPLLYTRLSTATLMSKTRQYCRALYALFKKCDMFHSSSSLSVSWIYVPPCPFVVCYCCSRGLHDWFLDRRRAKLQDSLTVGDLVDGTVIANVDVETMPLSVLFLYSCICSSCSYRSGLWSMVIIESPLTTRCC
jgi:hypothetical protein